MDANQQYVDAAVLQQVEGMHGMDAAAIAAAAQQLEAIHAALQQASNTAHGSDQMTAEALQHLHGAKPEDYLAHLAVVNAVAASAAEGAGNGHHQQLVDMQNDMDGHDGGGGDKPLTSRYRGVCWNKKNRRWQAAINSSGKYIYLGSFVQEEEAARAFDKAAIRLRGNRAKLNYSLSDYVDDAGNLVDDPRLSAHLQNVLGKEGGKGGKSAGVEAPDMHGGLLTNSNNQQNMLYGQNLQSMAQVRACMHILGQGKSPHYPYSGAQKQAYGVLDVPEGCSLVAHIVGDEEAFAVLYIGPHIPPGGLGALVWDGSGAIDLGVFETDKDARNAAGAVLKLAMFHKHTLTSALASQQDHNAAQQQAAGIAAAQYGLLLGGAGGDQSGGDGDAAAMAAAAAAAATVGDPNALAQHLGLLPSLGMPQGLDPGQQNQYKELFTWLAGAAPRVGKAEDGQNDGGQGDGSNGHHQHTEAEVAGAEAIAAMMMSAGGALKNMRDQEDQQQGGGGDDGGGGKRARNDDGMAQMKNLSGFKLQDVMKSLFDPNQQGGQQGGM